MSNQQERGGVGGGSGVGFGRTEAESRENIRTHIYPTSAAACANLASEIATLIRTRQSEGSRPVVLGLATGSTPVPLYRELIRLHQEENLSFRNVITFNLDEYYGLPPTHRESYHRFMNEQLFSHLTDLDPANVHVPSGTTPPDEVYDACREYESAIEKHGGIDIQLLGIGRDGHIGFNEPGSTKDSRTRRIALDAVTRRDAAPDFMGMENVPRFAVTMGVGTILQSSRRIVLMAWGENKAKIVAKAIEGPQTESVPSSFLQGHANASFLLDEASAKELTRVRRPWLVRSVRWTPEMKRRAVVWLSSTCKRPILKLLDGHYNENGLSELLVECDTAGSGSAGSERRSYELNIDTFKSLQNTITGWPGGKPNADDSNRPERTSPFPKRVVVFSPEPQDAVVSMAGTLQRLCEQGHDVRVVNQTSGSLRVPDREVTRFCRTLQEIGEIEQRRRAGEGGSGGGKDSWSVQVKYAADIASKVGRTKGGDGDDSDGGTDSVDVDPDDVRRLKALILRGEARDAASRCGLPPDRVTFLDLPFYDSGYYRRFHLGKQDVASMENVLRVTKPHQIFATGNLADPSSMQSLCYGALRGALSNLSGESWMSECRLWTYRGKEEPVQPHEIDMAVPMSPDQVSAKVGAVRQFAALTEAEVESVDRDRDVAVRYDKLGLAEYEAIEAFESTPI